MLWPHLGYPGNPVENVFLKLLLEALGGFPGRPGEPQATKMTPKATRRDPKITPETPKNKILGDASTPSRGSHDAWQSDRPPQKMC